MKMSFRLGTFMFRVLREQKHGRTDENSVALINIGALQHLIPVDYAEYVLLSFRARYITSS